MSVFLPFVPEGGKNGDFLFASIKKDLSKWWQLLKKRTCSWRANAFPFRDSPNHKGGGVVGGMVELLILKVDPFTSRFLNAPLKDCSDMEPGLFVTSHRSALQERFQQGRILFNREYKVRNWQ